MNGSMKTIDNFLGGQLKIAQPKAGYRAGSDAVLLAAFLPEVKGHILDAGCGVGTVSLCGAYRLKEASFTGIDCQEDLITLAKGNAESNGLEGRVQFLAESLETYSLKPGTFDHVVTNPPYFEDSAPSPHEGRALARSEGEVSLEKWMKFCIKMAKPRGYISFIYPADSLSKALKAIEILGEVVIVPLWSKAGEGASRCLIRGRKDVKSKGVLSSGLVLHEADGSYTAMAKSILWDGVGIIPRV